MTVSIFILHGFGANADDLRPLESYLRSQDSQKFFFPEAPIDLNQSMGFPSFFNARAWFPIDVSQFQQRQENLMDENPQELDQTLDYIKEFIDQNKASDKIVIGGFSQGAMCAYHFYSRFGSEYDIKSLLLMSTGLIAKVRLNQLAEKNILKKIPVFLSHGQDDEVILIKNAQRLKDYFEKCGYSVEYHSFSGGHQIPLEIIRAANKFLSQFS
ncbi:MAG: dienelactone hydrolase family protein [Halobacteriovoraceae bacterium]|nr:dienelactone hydrolase family protein [Halobacteriovoraceae bacterium]